MSAADDAWRLTADEMDLIVTEFTESRNPYDFIPAMARIKTDAYRRALEDAADAWQQGQWSDALSGTQRPDPIQARLAAAQAVTDWLRARAEAHNRPPIDIPDRAAAVTPRETKD